MNGDIDGYGPDDIRERIDVSRETFERLDLVLACLDDWRTRMNLIGPRERDHIWRRHIYDSLRLWPHLQTDAVILDLGSGGGFPGLPLACALTAQGTGHVTMVESKGKKAAFLRAAIEAAGLNADVRNERIETLVPSAVTFVTARALAPLEKLLEYAVPWLEKGAIGLFHKGEQWNEELTRAAIQWTFAHEAVHGLDGEAGIILKVSEVSRERTQDQSSGGR